MPAREYDLGDAELEVLKTLWEEGPGTVRHVLTLLQERGRSWAYTTVQTLLTRLEVKKFVTSNKSDVAFVYRAAVSRDKVTRSRVKSVVDKLFDGAAAPLVLQLIRTQRFSAEEIEALQELIDQLDVRPDE